MHLLPTLLLQFPTFHLLYAESIFLNDLLQYIFFFMIFLLGVKIFSGNSKRMRVVHSHWHHCFNTPLVSTIELYEAIETDIKSQHIPGVSFYTIKYAEGNILSAQRTYFRIAYRGNIFDICAAPFGDAHFFVSWWLGDNSFSSVDFLNNLNIFKTKFQKREKTFYEHDTEIMFKETVTQCVQDAIQRVTEEKGMRKLEDADLKIHDEKRW